jgi:D-alanyl-D-alanine carboxypeptidase/D-alanyl-D-alanine-endopeptidase (penicillin-binding protein 4)
MKKISSIIFTIFFISQGLFAQTFTQKIETAFSNFKQDEQLKYASYSLTVLNSNTGSIIFEYQKNQGLAPASTLKTITSATALDLLGQDFTFKTEILYTGNIVNGTLSGDLIIKGGGDPTLGSWRWEQTKKPKILAQILSALQQKGIKVINGNIIGDASNWDTQSLPVGWIWQDLGNYYGAGTSALCWGENQFGLNFSPAKKVGEQLAILNEDKIYPFLDFKNELTTGNAGSGDGVYAYSAPYSSTVYLRGTYAIDLKKEIGLSLPNPALAMAFDVKQYLAENNIGSKSYLSKLTNENKKEVNQTSILTTTSPSLKEIIYWFNQKSVNLYGEQLIRTLGWKFGKNASTTAGVKHVQEYWKGRGIEVNSLNIVDGSGLSPQDRVTTYSMASVLLEAKKKTWFDAYYQSLPTYNNMKMKSGTIADVLGYAGYADNGGKTPVTFSLLINNYTGSAGLMRQKMFALLNTLK